MTHLGDITRIDGGAIEPVDVITFGSPCQDLSIAGKRAGLAGERSNLFLEAVRIIKEMRCKTDGKYPTFAVWENVPGAFSSNKGEDFRRVLQELAALCDDTVSIPRPAGRWLTAGEIMGDGYSIAWRVMDAQYWGVPQRRRRIALVVDFGGGRAGKILFDPAGVSGDPQPRGAEGKSLAGDVICGLDLAEGSSRGAYAVYSQQRFGKYAPGIGTLTGSSGRSKTGETLIVYSAGFKGKASAGSGTVGFEFDRCPTLTAGQISHVAGYELNQITSPENRSNPRSGDPMPTLSANGRPGVTYCIMGNVIDRNANCNGAGWREDVSYTLNTMDRHAVMCMMSSQEHAEIDNDLCGTLSCKHEQPIVCVGIDCRHFVDTGDVLPTLQAGEGRGYTLNGIHAVLINSVVRCLTLLECERLQGYPDGWTEIPDYIDSRGRKRKTSDSARYTALGNSIALPQWRYVLGNISRYLPPGATLGSLFDGIGGFPLVWEEIHGKGTAVWASEINEFCIAVTKYRFGG